VKKDAYVNNVFAEDIRVNLMLLNLILKKHRLIKEVFWKRKLKQFKKYLQKKVSH
jgi:hypothetical protein